MFDPDLCLLPDALARTGPLVFLTPAEARVMNQLRARRHAALLAGDAQLHVLADLSPAITVAAAGALSMLFELGQRASASIGLSPIQPVHVAAPRDTASVAFLLVHAGWANQMHEPELARDASVDPGARDLLVTHAHYAARQLARVERVIESDLDDTLRDAHAFAGAIDGAIAYLCARDQDAAVRVEADLATFSIVTGRALSDRERSRVLAVQRTSLRWNHLGAGLAHPRCHVLVSRFAPHCSSRVAALATACA
jgi:hypothetical protein